MDDDSPNVPKAALRARASRILAAKASKNSGGLSATTAILNALRDDEIGTLASAAFEEFGDVGDYIWKSPRLIESEKEVEIEKLHRYFPDDGDAEQRAFASKLRLLRWSHESRKLATVFPRHMAEGNFFASVSLFEAYCLKLCLEMQRRGGPSLSDITGRGAERSFNYFRTAQLDYSDAICREQIDCAFLVRNCLFHANGVLAWAKRATELERIVKARTYLSKETRAPIGSEFPDLDNPISIVDSPFGLRLQITNHYSHIANAQLRNFFVHLCSLAQDAVEVDELRPTADGQSFDEITSRKRGEKSREGDEV